MKQLLILLVGMTFFPLTKAQAQIDSLWTVWHDTTMADTNRLAAIRAICQKIRRSRPDTLLPAAQLYFEHAERMGEAKHMGIAKSHFARYYRVEGDLQQAIKDQSHTTFSD